MFTGIVEEVGKVVKIEQRGENRRITVEAVNTPKELGTGHSVAVSGVCLTALDIKPKSFCADLAPETWSRTSFSRIRQGALVNLELPMKADGRFGGHIVQGHVDGVGKLIGLERIADSENWWLHIEMPRDVESTPCSRARSRLRASASRSQSWKRTAAPLPSSRIRSR